MLWTERIIERGGNTFIPTRINLSERYSDLKYQLKKYKELKGATEKITFSCFGEGNKCQKRVAEDSNNKCCCSGCHSSLGYFEDDLIFEKDFQLYNELFVYDEKDWQNSFGFWRNGTGCALPRELRSKTCITYNCESDGVRAMINAIDSQICKIVDRIKIQLCVVLSKHIIKPRIKKKYSAPKEVWDTKDN